MNKFIYIIAFAALGLQAQPYGIGSGPNDLLGMSSLLSNKSQWITPTNIDGTIVLSRQGKYLYISGTPGTGAVGSVSIYGTNIIVTSNGMAGAIVYGITGQSTNGLQGTNVNLTLWQLYAPTNFATSNQLYVSSNLLWTAASGASNYATAVGNAATNAFQGTNSNLTLWQIYRPTNFVNSNAFWQATNSLNTYATAIGNAVSNSFQGTNSNLTLWQIYQPTNFSTSNQLYVASNLLWTANVNSTNDLRWLTNFQLLVITNNIFFQWTNEVLAGTVATNLVMDFARGATFNNVTNNVNLVCSTNRGGTNSTIVWLSLNNFSGSNVLVMYNTNWYLPVGQTNMVWLTNGNVMDVALNLIGGNQESNCRVSSAQFLRQASH